MMMTEPFEDAKEKLRIHFVSALNNKGGDDGNVVVENPGANGKVKGKPRDASTGSPVTSASAFGLLLSALLFIGLW